MKRYNVVMTMSYDVMANDEEEAVDKAEKEFAEETAVFIDRDRIGIIVEERQ